LEKQEKNAYGFGLRGAARIAWMRRKPGHMTVRSKRGGRPARGEVHGERRARDRETPGLVRLFGLHAVEAALRNPERGVVRLLATENARRRLAEALAVRGVSAEPASPRDLDRLIGAGTVHQGVLAEVRPLAEPSLDDLARRADGGAALVILDHVTDPHNAGAVLRSAAVFGAAGLVMTRRHSPPLDGVLAKSASGALELVPVLLVQNLARTLLDLRGRGFTLIGLDDEATARIEEEAFQGRTALVLGAEGKGLRELTVETCDRLVRISGAGALRSLNVSNAAAVALHVAAMRREAGERVAQKP
jgi:23S rRNA (guanosine2251-2'-O)-methyltransferase